MGGFVWDRKSSGERGERMGLSAVSSLLLSEGTYVMVLVGMRLGPGGRRFDFSGSILLEE